MSQNKLSNVYNLQWELSNPQYYPDDSAPPVPNMAISTVEQNSLAFNNTEEYESLSDTENIPDGLSDLQNFAGVPNDLGFDYRTGATERTADHIFYSYLNVDAKIPPYHLSGDDIFIATYFRDFVPAACGLYNVEIPPGGSHIGYLAIPGWRTYSFYAFSEKDELMQGSYPINKPVTLTNRSLTKPRRFDVVDFAIHIIEYRESNAGAYTVRGPDFDIRYSLAVSTGSSRYSDMNIMVELLEGSTETVILDWTKIENTPGNKNYYILVRVDFTGGTVEVLGESRDYPEGFYHSASFSGFDDPPLFNVREFYIPDPPGVTHDHSTQLIGYARDSVQPLQEQYADSVKVKKYYYRLAYNFDLFGGGEEDIDEDALNFTIPAHNGNAWAYLNQLSTMFPFVRLV